MEGKSASPEDARQEGIQASPLLSDGAPGLTIEGRVANGRDNESPTVSSQPQFDPRRLLNPRVPAKRPRSEGPNHVASQGLGSEPSQGEVDTASMIERMHGVQRREDQPRRKVQITEQNGEAAEPNGNRAIFEGASAGSVLGDYVKENQDIGKREAGPSMAIDLTADDDDDDVVVVRDTSSPYREVCIGKLDLSSVHCHMVPTPSNAFAGSFSSHWPAIKVQLRRRPGSHGLNISVVDPAGRDFGKADLRTANILCPLLEAHATNGFRVEARIEPRRKNPSEIPGAPTSYRLDLNVHLFLPRCNAEHIIRWISQRNGFLREPTIFLKNVEFFNPQIRPPPMLPPTTYGGNSLYGYSTVARTVEEIKSDVQTMFDSLAKSEDIPEAEQDAAILTPLLSHQKQALHFMRNRESEGDDETKNETLWKIKHKGNGERYYYNVITCQETRRKPPPVRGGILADMMGLGKTLSILSLVVSTLGDSQSWSKKAPPQTPGAPLLELNSRATLLIAPLSTLANWEEQVKTHIKPGTLKVYMHHGPSRTRDPKALGEYDLVITTYQTVSSELKNQAQPISQVNWFRIVLDEAHMIRAQATQQSQAVCALSAQRRWAVTGTPVQNKLDDLGALMKFLRVKPFDEKGGFAQHIMAPFKEADPTILPKLRILVDSITLRRLKDQIDLPERHERLVKLEFNDDERQLYEFFAKDAKARMGALTAGQEKLKGNQMGNILRVMGRLRMICAHGSELLGDEDMKLTEGLSYANAIALGDEDLDDDTPVLVPKQAYEMLRQLEESDLNHCAVCDRIAGTSPNDLDLDDLAPPATRGIIGYMTACYHVICQDCIEPFKTSIQPRTTPDNYMTCPLCDLYVRAAFFTLKQDEAEKEENALRRIRENPRLAKQLGRYGGPHTKVKVLVRDLQENDAWSAAHSDEAPMKSVVFSGWTSYLDLIQIALEDNNISYTRLDGTMPRKKRNVALDTFRDDTSVRVMLVSIKAGGLGLNLTSASKAYVMEPQYNPASEAQAVDRVHRLGQKRPVTINHYIMNGSFEEKVLELQNKKKDLADLSVNRNAKLPKEEVARERLQQLVSLFR
ncbi:transcription termination factor 2 [Saccharata proteae CBS 121410]|uniref:Transcription termination factor 2 n=1 Tax=Saccharata proteae CBS 121410 TaxID=1314787 RepID=A0A6A5YD12_9PEZI|nr:transcription termination factor 2 [Saccharata proteae CBS 121410]